ncbi:hypothetical protein EV363DRAFT_153362 [Boletus edulis]|nr:hypothetical protein EV363DRAFT_153362 [Boletus edulis]
MRMLISGTNNGHRLGFSLVRHNLCSTAVVDMTSVSLNSVKNEEDERPVGQHRRWRGRQKCESVGYYRSHITNTPTTCPQICYYHWTGTTLVVCNCAGYLSCAVDCLWPDADAALTDDNYESSFNPGVCPLPMTDRAGYLINKPWCNYPRQLQDGTHIFSFHLMSFLDLRWRRRKD